MTNPDVVTCAAARSVEHEIGTLGDGKSDLQLEAQNDLSRAESPIAFLRQGRRKPTAQERESMKKTLKGLRPIYRISGSHENGWTISSDREGRLGTYETRETARVIVKCFRMSVLDSQSANVAQLREGADERRARSGESLDNAIRREAYFWAAWLAGKKLDLPCEGHAECRNLAATLRQRGKHRDCLWLCESCAQAFDRGKVPTAA